MSNYMFMLENHLTGPQSRVLAAVQEAAAEANLNLFLAGGAMRDMLGGFPIRDLDFVVEGNAIKLARTLATATGAAITSTDEAHRTVELLFPGGATAQIGTSRKERYPKPGSKPQITPADIHDHLRGRDFTVNSMALSLSRASRGLLLDPANGLADLAQRQLRAMSNYTFHDQPIRLFRIIRLKVRMNFEIAERTRSQFDSARAAGVEKYITAEAVASELRRAALEPNPGEVLQAWEQEGLLRQAAPMLAGAKLNSAGFQKLHKARQAVPFGLDVAVDDVALFFHVLTEKLSAKERTDLLASLGISKAEAESWQKLEARSKKVEKDLGGALHRPSQVYRVLSKVPAELIVFLLLRSTQRVVHDRARNYFAKYLPSALEVTDEQVPAKGAAPGTPKFEKLKSEMISKKLDARPKKAPEVPEPATPPPPGPKPRFSSQFS
jgi:tRNA nucleotidyltransferase/poly(A) polymerase